MSSDVQTNYNHTDIMKLAKQYREGFIAARAKQEQYINDWYQKCLKTDQDVISRLNLPDNFSLKVLIPELYEDEPREEVYSEQYRKAMELFVKINKVIYEYALDAVQQIKEFTDLSSKE